jgi:hypothetical protein
LLNEPTCVQIIIDDKDSPDGTLIHVATTSIQDSNRANRAFEPSYRASETASIAVSAAAALLIIRCIVEFPALQSI